MKCITFVVCVMLLAGGNIVHAAENGEIEFLLSHVASSECSFIRNGKAHQAKEASDHLKKKYSYGRSRIKTAEDFINKIATKSSLSGKLYMVNCADHQIPTRQWLQQALTAHREKKAK